MWTRDVWQGGCICVYLVVRTLGEILRTRGHVDEDVHPVGGAVDPFVSWWKGASLGRMFTREESIECWLLVWSTAFVYV